MWRGVSIRTAIVSSLLLSVATAQVANLNRDLREAAQLGYAVRVKDLLNRKADVNSRNAGGDTALTLAAKGGHAETVRTILSFNPDDSSKARAMVIAAQDSFLDVLQAVLESGVPEGSMLEPMQEACTRNHLEMVRLLIRFHYDVDAGPNGNTPLSLAVSMNNIDLMQILLAAGASVNRPNGRGVVPLLAAASEGNTDVVETLLAYGAQPNVVGRDGETPLGWAIVRGRNEVARMLLANGANPGTKDARGVPMLTFAVNSGRPSLVRLLASFGARLDEPDALGRTPLMLAVSESRPELVRLLLELRANPSIRDYSNRSILDVARSRGNTEVLDLLRRNGAQ